MKNQTFLGAAFFSLALPAITEAQQTRPNIIVILADDMGYADLGCFGSEIYTPNLDRLSREGIRMTQFYNAGRSCPSRAALMTGMYHHKAGVGAMIHSVGDLPAYQGFLNDSCITIAEALRGNGYSTYMSGKWHIGSNRPHWPVDRGFDSSFVFLNGAGNYFYPGGVPLIDPIRSASMAINDRNYEPPRDGYYQTDAFTENAVRFIKESKHEKPFFLYLAYTAPHWPLQAYPEDIAKYKGKYNKGWDAIRKERYNRMVKMGIVKPEWKLSDRDATVPAWETLNDSTKNYWSKLMEVYAAMIDRMDQGIGKVIAELERTNQLDNTLIMFVADNGGAAELPNIKDKKYNGEIGTGSSNSAYEANWANVSNVPFRFFKHWMHEGGISTPFVARYPKAIKAGTISSVPAHLIDIMATCLDVSSTKYPTATNSKLKPLDGKSLMPVFKGKSETLHNALFFEHMGYRALRKGDYKIVSTSPKNIWELYNLTTDRSELHDLSKSMPEKVAELDALYTKMAKESDVTEWSKIPKTRRKTK